jgi:ABC-type transport system involved in multi-copper enzyme maturation permease subunit
MSVQTGALPPSGPVSSRMVDRARFRVDVLRKQPNPIWIRELRQSARLGRTPVILTVITVLMTLLIASIGGLVSTEASPATTGVVIFQVFFSIAYFVVTLVGPAVAANSIASEREGRTWEAVILTGLAPATVARGKFLAAFTTIAMYIVMLAPVGALPFLFGGVTATEVVVAFAGLFLIALLSVAFGLAVSSKMASLRAAIVVTLLLAFPATIAAFLGFGVGLSYAAHHAWPGVAEGPPIWLPTAYERAPFDALYAIYLVAMPVLGVTLPAWFLYEVTIANLTSVTDDRSSGLKRWFLAATAGLTLAAAVPLFAVPAGERAPAAIVGLAVLSLFFAFCVFLFAGDPIGPSRRVTIHWDRAGAGRFRRFLGPGVMRAASLLLVAGGASLLLLTALGLWGAASAASLGSADASRVAAFGGYALAFYVFVVGLGAALRARASSPIVARMLLFAFLFAITVGPWVVAAIAGILAEAGGRHAAYVVAAPSPFYVLVMMDAMGPGGTGTTVVAAGMIFCLIWAALGLLLLAFAARRCGVIIRKHEALLAESDRILAAEDEAAAAPPPDAPPEADAPAEVVPEGAQEAPAGVGAGAPTPSSRRPAEPAERD